MATARWKGLSPPTRGSPGSGIRRLPGASGLSPPTRGSNHWPGSPRSIPAHAGEPDYRHRNQASSGLSPPTRGSHPMQERGREEVASEVYPRPRGGAGEGPRCRTAPVIQRSIPAHAGERQLGGRNLHRRDPRPRGRAPSIPPPWPPAWVYPRPRGGAGVRRESEGRSIPAHARGAHMADSGPGPVGSIPAHAGEPAHSRR